jgi:hypothetical protein
VAGGLEVIVDQFIGVGMQRQIARLLSFAGYGEVRNAPPNAAEDP